LDLVLAVEKTSGATIQRLAARSLIRDLEEGTSHLHNQEIRPSEIDVKQEIVRLGEKYNMVSKYTSFIAIQDRQINIGNWLFDDTSLESSNNSAFGQLHCKRRRADAGGGRGGRGGSRGGSSATTVTPGGPPVGLIAARRTGAAMRKRKAMPQPKEMERERMQLDRSRSRSPGKSYHFPISLLDRPLMIQTSPIAHHMFLLEEADEDDDCDDEENEKYEVEAMDIAPLEEKAAFKRKSSSSSTTSSSSAVDSRSSLMNLLKLQKIDGSFEASQALATSLRLALSTLSQIPSDLALPNNLSKLWTTALVIAFITKEFASLKSEWELVVGKSKSWIDKQLGVAGLSQSTSPSKLISRAQGILSQN